MKLFRRFIFICLLCLALFTAAGAYEIQSYDTVVNVGSDNCYTVTETIMVDFTDSSGETTRVIALKTPSGKSAKLSHLRISGRHYSIHRDKDAVTVTLGGDGAVSAAEVYTLSYEYKVGYDFDETRDLFAFQLIDAQLGAKVDSFTFTITMPAPIDEKKFSVISGYYGQLSSTVDLNLSGSVISGAVPGGLMAYEAIAVQAELDNGYFTEAVYKNNLADYIQAAGPFLVLIMTAAAMVLLFTRCKNPAVSPAPEGGLPAGLTPPDMSYIINGDIPAPQLTSLIPYWASRGLIILGNVEKGVGMVPVGALGEGSRPYERLLFDAMFPGNAPLLLNSPDPGLQKALRAAAKGVAEFWNSGENRIFKPQRRVFPLLAALLPLAASVFACIACGNSIYRARLAAVLIILLYLLLGVLSWAVTMACGYLSKKQGSRRSPWGFVLGTAWMAIAGGNLMRDSAALLPLVSLLAAMGGGFTVGLYLWDMMPRTDLGLDLLGKSLALRDFIRYAADEQARPLSLDNPAYFFEVLPFAGVFSLEGVWADKFLNVRLQSPLWYRTAQKRNFVTPLTFHTELEETMQTVKLALTGSQADKALTYDYLRAAARNLAQRLRKKYGAPVKKAVSAVKSLASRLKRRDKDEL